AFSVLEIDGPRALGGRELEEIGLLDLRREIGIAFDVIANDRERLGARRLSARRTRARACARARRSRRLFLGGPRDLLVELDRGVRDDDLVAFLHLAAEDDLRVALFPHLRHERLAREDAL